MLVAVIASFITPFMGSSINVALPAIGKSFGSNAVMLSWIATAYLLAAAVSLVPCGRLADIYGRKRILAIGFANFAIGSLACGFAVSGWMLILFRIVQGIGSGMIFSTGVAILVGTHGPRERGKVLGITISAVYVGLLTGPFIGGVLTEHLTWRSIFWITSILSSVVFFIILLKLRGEWAEAKGDRFDFIGSLAYASSLVTIIYGLSILPSLNSLWLVIIGLVGMVFFVRWQMIAPYPLLKVVLFKENRLFAFSNLAALIHYSATFALTFLLSLFLQYVKAFTPQITGVVLMVQPLMMAVFTPFTGRLSDRMEPRLIATTGMFITALLLFLLIFIDRDTHVLYIISCLMLLGFGYALFSSPNMNAIMSSVEKKYLGIASGSAATMRLLGQMVSMAIATLAISLFVGKARITPNIFPNFLQSIRVSLIIFCVLCLVGSFLSMQRGNVRK